MENEPLIQETIEHWQKYSGIELKKEDAQEILKNTIGLFEILSNRTELSANKEEKSDFRKASASK